MNLRHPASSLAALIVAGLVATGCTPAPTPSPSVSVTPSVAQAPTETTIERQQRLDYEAAEKSYRTFRAEVTRLAEAGGSARATTAMKATAGGPYLEEYVTVLRSFKQGGFRDKGNEKIIYIRRGGYSADSLLLNTCEDSRAVVTYNAKGQIFGKGEVRTAGVEVRESAGVWKVWRGDGKKVNRCE